MIPLMGKPLARFAVLLSLAGVVSLSAQKPSPAALRQAQGGEQSRTARPANDAAAGEKVVSFVREHFGFADAVKLTISPWRISLFPSSSEAILTLDDGKQKKNQMVLLSRSHRYLLLVIGEVFDFGEAGSPNSTATGEKVAPFVRVHLKIPDAFKLTTSPLRSSVYPSAKEATLTLDDGKRKVDWTVLISKDGRYLVLGVGEVFDLNFDVKQEALKTISTSNQPSQGPANAPVTIVEYADLECPMCARVHEFFERELLPKYGDKVRLVFKDYPLVAIHDWALAGSLAGQCIYAINAGAVAPFRSLVFQNQMSVNATNSREMLLTYGEQAGVDRVKLAPCLDAKTFLPRVEEDMAEAKRLKIMSTPTCFINGKMIVGFPSPDAYFKAVDEALSGAK